MVAKELLPVFGGASAVWITCLVFFQAALLVGYLYAHLLARNERGRWWIRLHRVSLAAALLCAALWASGRASWWSIAEYPALSICIRLTFSIGLPFTVLASTSPLLQVWLRRVEAGSVPYRLYGLSNIGSLLALAAYPTLVEPHLALRLQRSAWCAGFAVFSALSVWLAWRTANAPCPIHRSSVSREQSDPAISSSPARTKLFWLLLPMAGAMQLSAVTEHMTANVAAIPLLWIIPLATYLLTFVIAFQGWRWLPRTSLLGVLAVMLYALGNFLTRPEYRVPVGLSLGLFLAELLAACLVAIPSYTVCAPKARARQPSFI